MKPTLPNDVAHGVIAKCGLCDRWCLYVECPFKVMPQQHGADGVGGIVEIEPSIAGGGVVDTPSGQWARNRDPEVVGHKGHTCRGYRRGSARVTRPTPSPEPPTA